MEKIYSLSFDYGDRFTVVLGSGENTDEKIRLLLAVEQKLGPLEKGIIDISDTENIRFRQKNN